MKGTVIDMWRWHGSLVEVAIECDDGVIGLDLEKTPASLSILVNGVLQWDDHKARYTSQDETIKDEKIILIGEPYHLEGRMCPGRCVRLQDESRSVSKAVYRAIPKSVLPLAKGSRDLRRALIVDYLTEKHGLSPEDRMALSIRGLMNVYRREKRKHKNKQVILEDDAIHEWFGLSYSQYLTIPRSVLQSMPGMWQATFVHLLREMNETIEWGHLPNQEYRVTLHNVNYDGEEWGDYWGTECEDKYADYERGRRRIPYRNHDKEQ